MPHEPLLGIEECRRILGSPAATKTDDEVLSDRDQMEALAHLVFDQFTDEMKRDPDAMRWLLDAHENGGAE